MANEEVPLSDDPEYIARFDQYKALKAENFKHERKLKAKFGPAASLDDLSGLTRRVELFIEHMMPGTTVERINFEIAWQEMIKSSLHAMQEQLLQMQAQQGKRIITPGGPGGLIVP